MTYAIDTSGYDKEEIAKIEKTAGIKISELDQKTVSMAVAKAKEIANKLFKEGRYEEACVQYTCAIAGDRKDKTLFRNRAAARLQLGERVEAAEDAVKAVELDEKDAK